MFTLKCTMPAMFDVDDTLMKWNPHPDELEDNGIECKWPVRSITMSEEGKIVVKEQFEEGSYIPLYGNIEQLKEHKRRGHTVIVWSAGGWKWAENAVKMLGLEDYVDLVMEKPKSVYDDKALEEFMPKVQFIPERQTVEEEKPKLKKEIRFEADPFRAYGETTSAASPSRR